MILFVLVDMEKSQEETKETATAVSNDAYFETIQSRKKLSASLQETLTAAFATIPVSSFPQVPGGKGNSPNNHKHGPLFSHFL